METTYKYVRQEWRSLWNEKIEDRWRAESIARREYPALFVEQGDVVWSARGPQNIQLRSILERHETTSGRIMRPVDPDVGGWGKFIKDFVSTSRSKEPRPPSTRSDHRRGDGTISSRR